MADGTDAPSSRVSDALIEVAVRLGAVEQAFKSAVTHDRLLQAYNDLRRDFGGLVNASETHLKGAIDSQSILADKRYQDLQASHDRRISELYQSLDRMFTDKVPVAVKTALDARRADENAARQEIADKADDAVRGMKTIVRALGGITTVSLVALGAIGWKIIWGGGF